MTEGAADSLPTRQSLVHRLKDLGDDASWRDFFETYWELIYNLARKTGLTDAEAQDVVQATVIGVSRHIAGFEHRGKQGSFKAWLRQQTRWRIADQFRKRDKLAVSSEPRLQIYASPHGVADETSRTATVNRIPDPATVEMDKAWDAEWEKHLLKVALDRVKARTSDRQFQMFDLHALQGLSAKETAWTLGTSVIAVHMATSRLRRRLQREVMRLEKSRH
jgi:RNA polymerase sigma-70 factor (ECF subfamily)